MNNNRKIPSSRTINDTRSHCKITRTVTDTDGKIHTETVEMEDDDALKVSLSSQKSCSHLYNYFDIAYARYAYTSR